MKYISIIILIALFVATQFVGCGNAYSYDELIKQKISKAVELLAARDKMAEKPSRMRCEDGSKVFISTAEIDDYVKKQIGLWIKIANDLENYSANYPASKYSNDTIFVATLLWVAISQADRQYCEKTIEICKKTLSTNETFDLTSDTLRILKKIPSVNYLIENEFSKEGGLKFFLRRMLVSEYIKMDNLNGAKEWLKTAEMPSSQKEHLNRYIASCR